MNTQKRKYTNKVSINVYKLLGFINLILGFFSLYGSYLTGNEESLNMAAIQVVLGGIIITINKGKLLTKTAVKLPKDK